MDNGKKTIVQNYEIFQRLYQYRDLSEFFRAQHTVLKKMFTLRKIKVSHSLGSQSSQSELSQGDAYFEQLELINDEVNLLRKLNGVGCPQCHKLIRTANNIYLVYENLPLLNLKEHLLKNFLTKYEKLELMIKMASTLIDIHLLGVTVVGMDQDNIRVYEGGRIVFTDLSKACMKGRSTDAELYQGDYPEELTQRGMFGQFTDVYMLGKVFQDVINVKVNDPLGKYRKVKQLIDNMVKYKPQDRISLQEVISALENEKRNSKERKSSQNECVSALLAPPTLFNQAKPPRKYSMGSTNSSDDIKVTIKHILMPKNQNSREKRDFPEIPSSPLQKNKRFSITTPHTPTNVPQRMSLGALDCQSYIRAASSAQKSCSSKSAKSSVQTKPGREANKDRNLAFFILDLAYFVNQQGNFHELTYLLTKYALLVLKTCLEHLQKETQLKVQQKFLLGILMSEKAKIVASMSRASDILGQEDVDISFRKELDNPDNISDRFLEEKIIQFSKAMLKRAELMATQGKGLQGVVDLLFNALLLLKKVEFQSYEQYWQSIYNKHYAKLSSQRAIYEEKELGYRYLRSKIRSVLKLE